MQISDQQAHPLMPGRSGAWGLAVVGIGLALVCHGLRTTVRGRRWRARATRVTGRIVDNAPWLAGRKGGWLPRVEYDVPGATVLAFVKTFDPRRRRPLGSRVDVLYNPSDPHDARFADDRVSASTPLVLGVFVICLYFAIVR